jgi:hypothetical protein
MTVFLAWTSENVDAHLLGPWRELKVAAPGLLLVDSDETLSRVYHELKWSLADGSSLLVAPLAATPKLRGVAPGTLSWLRARTSAPELTGDGPVQRR